MPERKGNKHVYLMRTNTGLFKIGMTNNIGKRMMRLSKDIGNEVFIVFFTNQMEYMRAIQLESDMLMIMPDRHKGEWFKPVCIDEWVNKFFVDIMLLTETSHAWVNKNNNNDILECLDSDVFTVRTRPRLKRHLVSSTAIQKINRLTSRNMLLAGR